MNVDPIAFAIPLYVILIVVEMLLWRFKGIASYEARDTATSFATGFGAVVVSALGASAVILASFSLAYNVRFFDAPDGIWSFALCLLLADFAYYWSHRFSHESRWLWASHVVHHSSQHYNFATALRSPWTDLLSLSFLFYAPICLLGFDPLLVFLCRGIVVAYQFWFHTETIDQMGWLEQVIVTPSHHRVHHAINQKYLDKNYGAILVIWDRMFGTFEREDRAEPPAYGIVDPIGVFNPITVAFHEWIAIARDVLRARSWRDVTFALFGPPGARRKK